MNNVQKGYYRDKRILETVEARKALTTEQIACLLFPGSEYGLRKAQDRLKKLAEGKRIKRVRLSLNGPYIYYVDRKSNQLEHLIAVNWAYVWMLNRLASWETLYFWDYEQDYKTLRCDAMFGILNSVTQEKRFWFVEMDRSENNFDKVEKYTQLYESESYQSHWWVKHAKRFPGILCVTESRQRLIKIQKAIEEENSSGLQFEVKLLEDLVEEATAPWKRLLQLVR